MAFQSRLGRLANGLSLAQCIHRGHVEGAVEVMAKIPKLLGWKKHNLVVPISKSFAQEVS